MNVLLAISQYAGDSVLWDRTEQLMDSLGDESITRSAIYRDAWSDVVRHGAGVHERVERAYRRRLGAGNRGSLAPGRRRLPRRHAEPVPPYLQRAVDLEVETGAVATRHDHAALIMARPAGRRASGTNAERTGQRALELTTSHGKRAVSPTTPVPISGSVAAHAWPGRTGNGSRRPSDAWARPRGVGS
ncbi:hypothetical protein [Nonomuraea dietziae]|uniref:hypothetical protein n=1 Tax=Nonomuraea dietziae TaxID=65515 RepID=UPI0031DF7DD2